MNTPSAAAAAPPGRQLLGHPVGPVRAPQNVITADDRRALEAAVRALPAAYFS